MGSKRSSCGSSWLSYDRCTINNRFIASANFRECQGDPQDCSIRPTYEIGLWKNKLPPFLDRMSICSRCSQYFALFLELANYCLIGESQSPFNWGTWKRAATEILKAPLELFFDPLIQTFAPRSSELSSALHLIYPPSLLRTNSWRL